MTLTERLQAAYRAHAACSRRHDLAGALLAKRRIAAIKAQIQKRLEQRLQAAESSADFWRQQAENLCESATGAGLQVGLTFDGQVGLLAAVPPTEGSRCTA